MRLEEKDRRVHDYLDGRLDELERTEFEARMAADPDLAGRVRLYREIRSALQQGSSDLPPGFLARARARFEAQQAPRPMWRRYLSWETAGLVTAGVVVLALLIPLGQRAPVVPDVPTSGEEKDLAGAPTEGPTGELPAAAPVVRRDPLGGEALQDQSAPAPPLVQSRTGKRGKGPVSPPGLEADALSAGSPPSQLLQTPVSAAARSVASPGQSTAAFESASERAEKGGPPEIRCQELPEEAGLASGLVTLIASPDQPPWEQLRMGPARAALERLAPDFRSERVVLIGPRPEPFACAGIRVVSRRGSTGIQLPEAGGREGLRGGCALAIPAGSSPVEIDPHVLR